MVKRAGPIPDDLDRVQPERAMESDDQVSAIAQADTDRVSRLLGHDLAETVGSGYELNVEEVVARIRRLADDPKDFEQRVVDDVQQWIHDSFADTSWPSCPEHPHHPLWYSEGWWRCKQSGTRVAPLGALRINDDRHRG